MTTFIHLSDLHIKRISLKQDNRHAQKLIHFITERYHEQDITVLITGDITDGGHYKEYCNACDILRPLLEAGFRVLPVPGNHDYGPNGLLYNAQSQQGFQDYMLERLIKYPGALEPTIHMEDLYPMVTELDDTVLIGLDSVVGNLERAHLFDGRMGETQRSKLKEILKSYQDGGKSIVVYFHHHPFNRNRVMEMDDATEVLALLSAQVQLVCFGHDHKSEVYCDKSGISLMLASGKSTEKSEGKLQFREITIDQGVPKFELIKFAI